MTIVHVKAAYRQTGKKRTYACTFVNLKWELPASGRLLQGLELRARRAAGDVSVPESAQLGRRLHGSAAGRVCADRVRAAGLHRADRLQQVSAETALVLIDKHLEKHLMGGGMKPFLTSRFITSKRTDVTLTSCVLLRRFTSSVDLCVISHIVNASLKAV